jgi:hypothetical protein
LRFEFGGRGTYDDDRDRAGERGRNREDRYGSDYERPGIERDERTRSYRDRSYANLGGGGYSGQGRGAQDRHDQHRGHYGREPDVQGRGDSRDDRSRHMNRGADPGRRPGDSRGDSAYPRKDWQSRR